MIAVNQRSDQSLLLNLARVQINGQHYSIGKITAADNKTSEYLQLAQNSIACFSRNGSAEVAITRLSSQLAFLTLNGYQVSYSHSKQIPTDSNFGSQPIYPKPIERAGHLFIMGYPTLMQLQVNQDGKDAGFVSKQLDPNHPKSPQNQVLDIQQASNGDWLVATESGWFRCDGALQTCSEVVPTAKQFYDSGVLDQNSQGFIFPDAFTTTSATNASATHPLFWSTGGRAWTLDRNFLDPIAFEYPDMDRYSVVNAKARGNRMAIMTVNGNTRGQVLYVENGSMHFVGLPVPSKYQVPMVTDMDVNGDRVFINIEGNTYVADFGGNFTALNTGELGRLDTLYAKGNVMALSAGTKLALSLDRGKTFTMVPQEKLGLPAGQAVQLSSYRSHAIAAVANVLYQLFLSPLAVARPFFNDTSTNALSIRESIDAGIWLDAGTPWNTNSRPRVITSSGNCYKLDSASGLSGTDDSMAFIAGSSNSTLYFAGPDGVVQLQSGFNKTADCGVAQLP